MPEPDKDDQVIIETFTALLHGRPLSCPLCGNSAQWSIEKFVPLAVSDGPKTMVLGGKILPLVALVCQRCGNTHFLNLLAMGLREIVERPDAGK